MGKKKKDFYDDGRTVADMDFHKYTHFSTFLKKTEVKKNTQESDLNLTAKEKWAMIKAMYTTLITFVIILFGIFALVFTILFAIWK